MGTQKVSQRMTSLCHHVLQPAPSTCSMYLANFATFNVLDHCGDELGAAERRCYGKNMPHADHRGAPVLKLKMLQSMVGTLVPRWLPS